MESIKREYYKFDKEKSLFLEHSPSIIHSKLKKKVSKRKIKEFLEGQRNYTLFKQLTGKKNERNHYKIYSIDELWEIDLMSLPTLAKYNSGIIYILVCIDCFSRFAFVRYLQNKQPRSVVKALLDIFKNTNRKPYTIQSDAGKEFVGKDMKFFLKRENIRFRIPKTTLPAKCAFVESLNRTLKQRIFRFINWKKVTNQINPMRYIDALQLIVDNYNRTKHSSTKTAPYDVRKSNATKIYHYQRKIHRKDTPKNPKLMEGEFVRVMRRRDKFEKGTMVPLWSDEIFRVKNVIERKPFPVYEIIDLNGRMVDGKLYERELQRVNIEGDTPLEILQRPSIFNKNRKVQVKLRDGRTQFLYLDEIKKKNKEKNYYDIVKKL